MLPTLVEKYSLTPGVGVVVYDPATLTLGSALVAGGSMALGAVGSSIGAAGTIAGGNAALQGAQIQSAALNNQGTLDLQASQFTADQLSQNATTAIASAQRQALDTRLQTSLVGSQFTARAAGSGLSATGSTAISEREQIAGRGEYLALGQMAAGENTAVGLTNEAAATIFSGQAQQYGTSAQAVAALYSGATAQTSAEYGAAATIAGGGASMLKSYGAYALSLIHI